MTLHFAYGSNMSRVLMRRHAPSAVPIGGAQLTGHRFIVTPDGYASVVPAPARSVHGVLWRITARDRVALDIWENVAAGVYEARTLPVRIGGRLVLALVYVTRRPGEGRPKPGYMELVLVAAREWDLPAGHLEVLARWLPRHTEGKGMQFRGPVRQFGDVR